MRLSAVLEGWIAETRRLFPISVEREASGWDALERMCVAATNLKSSDLGAREAQLNASSARLAPLEDPFSADFGLHRWLTDEREESYSDWLHYAVRELREPALVYGLFGLRPPASLSRSTPAVRREYPVEHGSADRSGRIDLLIQYAGAPPLVIEAKVTTAEGADTAKQSGYAKAIGQCDKVLLVTDAGSRESDGGFRVLRWLDVAKQLRRLVPRLCCDRRTVPAAMLLAFAGSIEQNLCGFPPQPLELLKRGVFANYERVISYLKEVLQP